MYTIIISYQTGLKGFVEHVTLIGRRVLAYNLVQGILNNMEGSSKAGCGNGSLVWDWALSYVSTHI